jgi:hypothetical protein
LVVQPAENWAAKNLPGPFDGTRERRILAHRPPGIVGTYNLHEYEDEKAEALEKWAQRLNSIVSPPAKVPDKKIVPLRKRRR